MISTFQEKRNKENRIFLHKQIENYKNTCCINCTYCFIEEHPEKEIIYCKKLNQVLLIITPEILKKEYQDFFSGNTLKLNCFEKKKNLLKTLLQRNRKK